MVPAAPQETVGEAGIEPGTAAWQPLRQLMMSRFGRNMQLFYFFSVRFLETKRASHLKPINQAGLFVLIFKFKARHKNVALIPFFPFHEQNCLDLLYGIETA
jgi:hypothetical protein